MKREVTQFERKYAAKANGIGLLFLAIHVPALCAIAGYMEKGVGLSAGIGILLLAGPGILILLSRESAAASVALGIASMGFSALAIHISGGMIEAHFHIFTMIALLTVFGRIAPILAAAVTIALHHLLFWMWLPASVFNYKASLGIVLLHAFFVVFETVPACWIAVQFGKNRWASGIVDERLDAATEQIGAASKQLRAAGEGLAQTAVKQAATFEETAATSAEIKASAHGNEKLSNDALHLIGTVNRQMSQANNEMDSVKTTVI